MIDNNELAQLYNCCIDNLRSEKYYNYLPFEVVCFLRNIIDDSDKSVEYLFPNSKNRELFLTTNKIVCYTDSIQIDDKSKEIRILPGNFINAEISQRFNKILLCVPLEKKDYQDVLYINKSIELLEKDGCMILILPQPILFLEKYKDVRKKIISTCSVESVITIHNKKLLLEYYGYISILIIKKKNQAEKIYMTDSFHMSDSEKWFSNYKNKENGFFVDSRDIYNRLDPNFYNPEHKKARLLIQNKNTEKLGKYTDIFCGINIPAPHRNEDGDYLIIKPQYIFDYQVHLGNSKKYFCKKTFVDNIPNSKRAFLRDGDVVISNTGKINWAIYHGESENVIANSNICIIRPKEDRYKELLEIFLTSKKGHNYFEEQLNFLAHCGIYHNDFLSANFGLPSISIPNITTINSIKSIKNEKNLIETLSVQFQNLGWDVKEEYLANNIRYDIALFSNGVFKAAVEVKIYKSSDLIKDAEKFILWKRLKTALKDVRLYLFIDEGIYEFYDEKIVELKEFPRPDNIADVSLIDSEDSDDVIITRTEDYSISDKLKMEMLLKKVNELSEKVDIGFSSVNEKLDIIINKLNNILVDYQQLVNRQLDFALSSTESEHIIHAFSEEFTEKVLNEIQKKNNTKEKYEKEENLLKQSFEDSWNKLDEKSKSFLITAKVIYNELNEYNNVIDYSGVCLLVTKALEQELSKRFCKGFISYLKERYPGKDNYIQFPSVLLDIYGKPITSSHFTLGCVAHLFCYYPIDKSKIKEYCQDNGLTYEQYQNNKSKLIQFCKDSIFNEKNEERIIKMLSDYAEDIEQVKNKYRNKAAHTNELKRVDAEECFEFVIDIEKLLKRMLDSFCF